MKFSDYSKNKENVQNLSPSAKSMLSEFLKKHNGKSQDQLLAEIEDLAKKQRLAGNLSDSDLDNFEKMLSPLLSNEEREKLRNLKLKLMEL